MGNHKILNCRTEKFDFKPLPELDKFNQQIANNFNTLPFTGNPEAVLNKVGG